MFWLDPTHQPTHPPNHTPTYGWGSLHRFQIFKQNWNILISSSAIEFEWFWGSPPPWGVGDGGGERVPPHTCTRMCTYTCTCTHMHIWHHREFPGIPPMGAAICMKLSCLTCTCVYACTCVHACACAHVWGAPPKPSPTPRATGSPKHQNSISLELIEIIQFCLKILYLWTFLNSYRL